MKIFYSLNEVKKKGRKKTRILREEKSAFNFLCIASGDYLSSQKVSIEFFFSLSLSVYAACQRATRMKQRKKNLEYENKMGSFALRRRAREKTRMHREWSRRCERKEYSKRVVLVLLDPRCLRVSLSPLKKCFEFKDVDERKFDNFKSNCFVMKANIERV